MAAGRLCIDQGQMSEKSSPPSKPESESLQSLKSENQRLRDLVVSLSAALLRNIAIHPPRHRSDASDAERLFYEAQEFFRYAEIPDLKKEIAEGLHTLGHEFMAKAVEIETKLQREKWKK
jgi:hypothetical protein